MANNLMTDNARQKAQGKTASGKPITEELIDKLTAKAEAGYDVAKEPSAGSRRGKS